MWSNTPCRPIPSWRLTVAEQPQTNISELWVLAPKCSRMSWYVRAAAWWA
jgi:hypothetical protein